MFPLTRVAFWYRFFLGSHSRIYCLLKRLVALVARLWDPGGPARFGEKALDVLRMGLRFDPGERPLASAMLRMPYFTDKTED